jgi:hypothetical protein
VGLSNQGLLQESIRGVTSTTYPMNGDWLALFALSNITTGTWDERCLQWINLELTASYTNLADAQHAYALAQGFDRWSDMSGLAPNVEQDTGNQTTTAATSDTATFTNATVTGRGVIVVFALKSGRRVSTLVDNKGNTYNRVGFAVDNSDAVVEMWYAQQITGGASHVITVTYDGSANCVWGAIEVSRVKGGGGLLDANSVRTTTRGGSGSSASVTVTSGTLRDRNELVVAMLSLAGGGANAGIDTPTAYTAITQFNNFDGIHAGHGAYRTAPNTQAQSATWTNDTTTAPYAAIIAAFRAVGAVSVSGTAPANTVVPAITGTPTEDQTLTSDTGTWSGTVVSYTYQWKADGVNISGATASTYVLTASQVGANITVAVTATNEVGSTTATSAAVGPVAAAGDASFSSVVLLLGFEGADAATSTTDESPTTPHTLTFQGNAQVDTAQKKFGTASLLLDGTGDYLSRTTDADFAHNADFTIECWIRLNSTTFPQCMASQYANSVGTDGWYFQISATGQLSFTHYDGASFNTTASTGATFTTGVWYHVAISSDMTGTSATDRIYIDGVYQAKTTYTRSDGTYSPAFNIGRLGGSNDRYFNGWIDELRITKGVARYTTETSFTVPSAAFPRS